MFKAEGHGASEVSLWVTVQGNTDQMHPAYETDETKETAGDGHADEDGSTHPVPYTPLVLVSDTASNAAERLVGGERLWAGSASWAREPCSSPRVTAVCRRILPQASVKLSRCHRAAIATPSAGLLGGK